MTARVFDLLREGDHASRPAATAVGHGTLYSCSDHNLVYQSDGATWSTWATLGGGAPSVLDDLTDVNAPSPADNDVLAWDDVAGEWVPVAPSGSGALVQVAKIKSADEDIANNTLQDDNHLTFPIAASEIWVVEYHLYAACASNSPDIKMALGVPVGATTIWGIAGLDDGATNTASSKRQSHASAALSSGIPASSVADTYINFVGTIENGANAGTVALQWAQNSTSAGNPTKVKRGSWMIATKVS